MTIDLRFGDTIDDKDLIMYVGDFIWGLSSDANGDFDGTLSKCVEMLRALVIT